MSRLPWARRRWRASTARGRRSGSPATASTAWTTRPERSPFTFTRHRWQGSATTTCTAACCAAARACPTSLPRPAPASTRRYTHPVAPGRDRPAKHRDDECGSCCRSPALEARFALAGERLGGLAVVVGERGVHMVGNFEVHAFAEFACYGPVEVLLHVAVSDRRPFG